MATKSLDIFLTIIAACSIIEPILTKQSRRKSNVRLNSQSVDDGLNFSRGNDDPPPSSGGSSSKEDNVFQLNAMLSAKTTMSPHNVLGFSLSDEEIKKFRLWPGGVIPYYIDVQSFSDKILRDKIRSFLNHVNHRTSLNFIEYPTPPSDDNTRWVFFINRRGLLGCSDHSVWNFTTTGVQRVVLGYDCMNKEGEIAEAVLAIAGVPAQHTAPDRDEYIKVNIENVIPDKRKLFDKLPEENWLFHDLPYDYKSAGHYHNFKYSENGRSVIEPFDPDVTIGETKELSAIDIIKIKLLYNFITKQKHVDAPECEKLFKVGTQLQNYKLKNIVLKANKKPSLYQSVPKTSIEYIEDDVELLQEDKMDKMSQDTKLEAKQLNNQVIKHPIVIAPMEKLDKTVNFLVATSKSLPSVNEKKYDQQQQLKVQVHYDPLADLSDDSSDDDFNKMNKIKKDKLETLKAAAGF